MKLKQFDHDGRARFITFCTHDRLPLLTNNKFRKIITESISKIRDQYKLKLLAYVIMPEHVHIVLIPPMHLKLGPVIGKLKIFSSKRIHEEMHDSNSSLIKRLTVTRDKSRKFVFWQRRCYDHNCRRQKSVLEKIYYCHNNPVIRGLVAKPENWIWSSYTNYFGEKSVMLEIDIAG
jgi:REP-associated tyrosine transposase